MLIVLALSMTDVVGNPISFSALWPHLQKMLYRKEKLLAGLFC
jgi:hypothetical protein